MANDILIQQKQALVEAARAQVRTARLDLEETQREIRERSISLTIPPEAESQATLIRNLDDGLDTLDDELASLQTAINDYNSIADITNFSTLQGQLQSAKDTHLQLKHDLKVALENGEDTTSIINAISTNTVTLEGHLEEYYAINDPRYLVSNFNDNTPFLLLPIRVETRYMTVKHVQRMPEGAPEATQSIADKKQLWLRFFPDDIAAHTHETRLTESEEISGHNYWNSIWEASTPGAGDPDPSVGAWRALIGAFGPERAAWIVKETEPTNLGSASYPDTPLIFPTLVLKPAAWTDSPQSYVLPDRFVVRLYTDDDNYREIIGNSIPDPLVLGMSPEDDPDTTYLQEDGEISFPDQIKWLSNFDEATTVGMGMKVDLQANEQSGIKRILVLGLKLSADKTEATTLVEELFENHHYTDGGLSLIKQGTPTNNTEDVKSGFTRMNDDAKATYDVERNGPLYTTATDILEKKDGQWFADLLGLDDSVVQNLENADGTDICEAIAMNRALWPATMGYYLKQMLQPHVSIGERIRAQQFFNEFVTGRGKIPAFRVGNQPYGVIPSTAFTRWTYEEAESETSWEAFYNRLNQNFIQPMNYTWGVLADEYVKGIDVNNTESAPSDLFTNILTLHASSVQYHQRYANGTFKMWNIWQYMNGSPAGVPAGFPKLEGDEIEAFLNAYNDHLASTMAVAPKILELNFSEEDHLLNGPVIDGFEAFPYSETRGILPFPDTTWNYIHWLIDSTSTIDKIRAEEYDNIPNAAVDQDPPRALLYLLLRHAYLQQYLDTSTSILIDAGEISEAADKEVEFQFIAPPSAPTAEEQAVILNVVTEELTQAKKADIKVQVEVEFQNDPDTARHTKRAREEVLFGQAQTELQGDINTEYNSRIAAFSADQEKWNYLTGSFPNVSGEDTMEEYLDILHDAQHGDVVDLTDLKNSLDKLKDLPTARLERAFAEHVDLCSYRLDAWMIGLVNQRLESQQSTNKGLYLGAFGMLENLQISTTLPGVHVIEVDENGNELTTSNSVTDNFEYLGSNPTVSLERDADSGAVRVVARVNANNQGYIHTPSVNHAVTAAILRAGYLSHQISSGTDDALAVNLTSKRIRRALYYLEGVRNGQALPALLGYRFERELHDRSSTFGSNLDQYILDIRQEYPLLAGSVLDDPNAGAIETAEAKNVIDALALMNAYEANSNLLDTIIPTATTSHKDEIKLVIDQLQNDMDAIADLLLSESVYQMAKGNVERAGAVMKALGDGSAIQEPEIVKTPRTGHALTHKFGIQFDTTQTAANIWTSAGTPRSKAEPTLNGWLAGQLPDPVNIIFNAEYDATPITVTLDDLDIEPIDFVHFIGDQGSAEDAAELSSRIAYHIKTTQNLTDSAEIRIDYLVSSADLTGSQLSLLQVLPLVKALKKLIGHSRPLIVEDYQLPADSQSGVPGDSSYNGNLTDPVLDNLKLAHGTTSGYAHNLKDLISDLETEIASAEALAEPFPSGSDVIFTDIRNHLLSASNFGIGSAVPTTVDDITTITERDSFITEARVILDTLDAKKKSVNTIFSQLNATTELKEFNKKIQSAGEILFGRNFKVYPQFELKNADAINLSRSTDNLLKGDSIEVNDLAPEEWTQTAAKVRANIATYQKVRLYSDTLLESTTNNLKVTQLPVNSVTDDRWLGMIVPSDYSPAGDTLSMVLELPDGNDAGGLQNGMLIDEWVETIPDKNVQTGVAMHYDQPNTEAPNSLIMAVTPEETGAWDWDDLMDTLNETLSLAKKRAVEPEHIKNKVWGQALPALLAAVSSNDTTPSLDFSRNIVVAPPGQYGPITKADFPIPNPTTI